MARHKADQEADAMSLSNKGHGNKGKGWKNSNNSNDTLDLLKTQQCRLGKCYLCSKGRHFAKDCYSAKRKKKAKAADSAVAQNTPSEQPAKPAADSKQPKKQTASAPAEKSTQKKEKEPKAKKPAENKGGNKAEEIGDPIPSMIDLRVGHIVDGMTSLDVVILFSFTIYQSSSIRTPTVSTLRFVRSLS